MKLSIIIPVYNVENYLRKCLDSVIYPELSDYEIIAVDDGSTDKSGEILSEYAALYPALLRCVSKENSGQGPARNMGAELATGEYVTFLDSDDYFSPGALEELLELCTGEHDIVFFDCESVDESGKVLSYIPGAALEGRFSLASSPRLLLSAPGPCNKLIRRSLITDKGISFPGRVWYEDLRTVPKYFLHATGCIRVKKPYYRYLLRQGSTMNNRNTGRNLEIIEAIDDLCSYYRAQGAYDKYGNELEYLAFYHQYICAVVRVCLADAKSDIADKLRADFLSKFPGYRNNPYVKDAPAKYKLLDRLIYHRLYGAVALIMGINAKRK